MIQHGQTRCFLKLFPTLTFLNLICWHFQDLNSIYTRCRSHISFVPKELAQTLFMSKTLWKLKTEILPNSLLHQKVLDRQKLIHYFWNKSKNFKAIYQPYLCFPGIKVKSPKKFKPDLHFSFIRVLAPTLICVHFPSLLAIKEFKRKDEIQSVCMVGY